MLGIFIYCSLIEPASREVSVMAQQSVGPVFRSYQRASAGGMAGFDRPSWGAILCQKMETVLFPIGLIVGSVMPVFDAWPITHLQRGWRTQPRPLARDALWWVGIVHRDKSLSTTAKEKTNLTTRNILLFSFQPYFCGFAPFCSERNSRQAFQRAISNVEQHFPLVGLCEELKLTLLLAEWHFPRFFKSVNADFDEELHGKT